MRRYSTIENNLWQDCRFRALTPDARVMWLYLLTSPRRTPAPGILRTSILGIAEDIYPETISGTVCGTVSETVYESISGCIRKASESLSELAKTGWVKTDFEHSVVTIPRSVAHNIPANPNVVRGWRRTLSELPACEAVQSWIDSSYYDLHQKLGANSRITETFATEILEPFAKRFAKRFAKQPENGYRKQEQEQEQEQEKRTSRICVSTKDERALVSEERNHQNGGAARGGAEREDAVGHLAIDQGDAARDGSSAQRTEQEKATAPKSEEKKQEPLVISNPKREAEMQEARRVAEHLERRLAENHPMWKPSSRARIEKWAHAIDLMLRRDERSVETTIELIDWATCHEFWSSNIMSGEKLRKQWQTLHAQMRRDRQLGKTSVVNPQSRVNPRPPSRPVSERLRQLAQDIRDRAPIAQDRLLGLLSDAQKSAVRIRPESEVGVWLEKLRAAGRIEIGETLGEIRVMDSWDCQPADVLAAMPAGDGPSQQEIDEMRRHFGI